MPSGTNCPTPISGGPRRGTTRPTPLLTAPSSTSCCPTLQLFDGFEPVEQVAVLVDSAATRVGKSTSTEVLSQMLEHHIPAGLVVAGDELLFTKVLTADELSPYQKVYVPGELVVEGPQRAVRGGRHGGGSG